MSSNRYGNYSNYLNKRVKDQNCCIPGPQGTRGPQGLQGERASERLGSIAMQPWSPPGHTPIWDFPDNGTNTQNETTLVIYQQFYANGGLYRKITIRVAPTLSSGDEPIQSNIDGVKFRLGIFDNSNNSSIDFPAPGVKTGGFPFNLIAQSDEFEFDNTSIYQNQYINLSIKDVNTLTPGANLLPNKLYWFAIGVAGGPSNGYGKLPIAYRNNQNSKARYSVTIC